jgi:hypothetical protein
MTTTLLVRLALVAAGLVCVVSHALGIEAGHELHQYVFVMIGSLPDSH